MSDKKITFNSGTIEQVALELTKLIIDYDHPKNGKEILELYQDCYKAVQGKKEISYGRVTGL